MPGRPRRRVCVRLLFLVATALAVPAAADGRGLDCIDCVPLPEGYTVPADCVSDGAGVGRFIALETPAARVWVGASAEAHAYVAVFEGEAKAASWCRALAAFEELAEAGGNLQPVPNRSGLPFVDVSSFARPGGCVSVQAVGLVAWLSVSKRWELIVNRATSDSRCGEGEADPNEAAAKVHAEGLAAYRKKDFETAEAKWRASLPYFESVADLGFLLTKRGRHAEAEPLLLEAVSWNQRPASWLNLADLYWKTGHSKLAEKAYRIYASRPR